jgi:formylglycine-generating enzyme required for sulfatase activity
VRITKPFVLGTHHVTRGQFRQFVKDSGYKTDAEQVDYPGCWGLDPETKSRDFKKDRSWRNAGFPQTDEHPVVCVSWDDAVAFCKWLSAKEDKAYRLPTEAEWEYACRAGTTTRYNSGDDPETLAKAANVADAMFRAKFLPLVYPDGSLGFPCTIKAGDGYAFTAPVGQFKPNRFGLYDMHGNAFQFCADWYDGSITGSDYYRKSPVDDPKGADSGQARVTRGGSWSTQPYFTTSSGRSGLSPWDRENNHGFRVARTQ